MPSPSNRNETPRRQALVRDLAWALVNCSEFSYRH
jgi:hypothetical protein